MGTKGGEKTCTEPNIQRKADTHTLVCKYTQEPMAKRTIISTFAEENT